ncbi:MAG: TlpA family protein disulfide reductase [Planctomycetes bacterium]|nr:TlpA family protein disulfide reductase [Planctomycetota bacterium]
MNRTITLGCSICLLSFASCDRREVATAILTVGFSNQKVEAVENAWHTGVAPGQDVQERGVVATASPLDKAWNELQQLRERTAVGTPVTPETIDELIQRLDKLIATNEQRSGSGMELQSSHDAKLAALGIGADSHPSLYANRRDSFYRELFQAEYDSQAAANASVQRFVSSYLTKSEIGTKMPVALARHSTAHPDCGMNVQLYSTAVERLANEGEVPTAIEVASQGLRLCASHTDVTQLKQQLDRLRSANPGVLGNAMKFTSPTLRGRRFDLASMRGKPVLVVFWATWCPGCVQETPYIKDFYDRYHDDGLEVVGVSLDVDREKLAEFVGEKQLPWPQMFSNHPGNEVWNNPIAKHYGVDSIPQAFLLDETGTIVGAHLRKRKAIDAAIVNLLTQ